MSAPIVPTAQTLADLIAARTLIEKPGRWTKAHLAVDWLDDAADPNSTAACRWCMTGAVHKVTGTPTHEVSPRLVAALTALCQETTADAPKNLGALPGWNDSHSQGQVLKLYGAAIARLELQRVAELRLAAWADGPQPAPALA